MDTAPPITDDDIRRIVATATMADFRAAIAPWQDDGAARKKMVQKLHGGISDHFTWQKHEMLRLWREIDGAEPTVATVLAAEIKRFANRLQGKDYAVLNGLTMQYEAGFLEDIEKRFTAQGKHGPDVHRAVMNDIADPVSRYLSREGKGIAARRKKYPNLRMVMGRDANGAAVFTMTCAEEQADEAEKQRRIDARACNIAQIPDIEKFIKVITAEDPQFRKRVREQLAQISQDALLSWQKREVFDMLGRKETPDAAQLQPDARLDAALELAKSQFSQQFKKAVKQMPVMVSHGLRGGLLRHMLDKPAAQDGTTRQVVTDHFVAPVVQWMRQNFGDVAAYAGKFPDAVLVVDTLAPAGGLPSAHVYSAREAWNAALKAGLKTSQPVTAPHTAAFRRAPKPVT